MSTKTKKVKSVAVDKETTLELKVDAKTTDGDAVTFKILKASDDSEVDTIDGSLKKGKATAKWTAKGPEVDGAERAFRVYYTCDAGGVTATSEEMEVYLETLELTSCEEDGSTSLPDARFKVNVKDESGKVTKTVKGHTGSSGTFTLQNLPPGELEVVWGAPVRWKGWVDDLAGKKKAKLKKSFKAQLVFPTPGAHDQLVNLAANDKHPEWGSRLKVRVGIHADDGPSRAGDIYFCKVVHEKPDELSKRKDPARKLMKGKKHDWSDPDMGHTVELKKDGDEAVFEVELGLAGGDQVTIKVGGTETCEDGTVVVTNWRKLFYVLQRNASSVLHGLGRVATTLDPVFVRYEQHSEETFTKADTPASMAGSWVDSKEFGAAAGTDNIVIGTHNRNWFRERFKKLELPKETKKCIVDLIVCDKQYDGNDDWNKPHKKQVTSTVEKALAFSAPFPGELFPANIQDGKHPLTSGSWRSKAPKGTPFHGRKGKVTPDMITVDRTQATRQVIIDLNLAASGDPAAIVGDKSGTDDKYPIDVTLTCIYADGPYLGESANEHQLIVLQPGSEAFNDTITHELGHNMRQAVSPGTKPPKDLKLADHTEAYEEHGHQGPHCSTNLDSVATHVADAEHPWDTTKYTAVAGAATDEPDYELLRKSAADKDGAFGSCVMFGAGPDTDPSPATDGFCDMCKPFVKAAPLGSVS